MTFHLHACWLDWRAIGDELHITDVDSLADHLTLPHNAAIVVELATHTVAGRCCLGIRRWHVMMTGRTVHAGLSWGCRRSWRGVGGGGTGHSGSRGPLDTRVGRVWLRGLQTWSSCRSERKHPTLIMNSLAPGRCGSKFASVVFKLILRIDILSTSCDIGLRRVPQNPIDDKSTLVQAMARCRQATSQYLSQCWLRSLVATWHH